MYSMEYTHRCIALFVVVAQWYFMASWYTFPMFTGHWGSLALVRAIIFKFLERECYIVWKWQVLAFCICADVHFSSPTFPISIRQCILLQYMVWRMRFLMAILEVYKDIMLSMIMIQNFTILPTWTKISLSPSVHHAGRILIDSSNKSYKMVMLICNIDISSKQCGYRLFDPC